MPALWDGDSPPAIERAYCERELPGRHRGFGIMLLRVVGVLIAATLACAVAHTARAEPRPANSCKRATFRAMIDVGHSAQAPGATSARGFPEFSFNFDSCQTHRAAAACRRVPAQRAPDHRRPFTERIGGARQARQRSRS